MRFPSLHSVSLGLLVVAAHTFTAACTDDAKKVEETVAPAADAAPAAPAPAAEAPEAEALTKDVIYFSFDDANLTGQSQEVLNKVGEALKRQAQVKLTIEGHTDERGSTEYNLALGERRARAVKNYLANLGVDTARLSTISMGEERPAAEGHGEQAWSQNRRAAFGGLTR